MKSELRVAIVAEHASLKFGGEAALPLQYFRVLRARGVPVWLVVHARTRQELSALFPDERRILYVEDTPFHLWVFRLAQRLPDRISNFTAGFAMRLATQRAQQKIVKRLVGEERVNLVHQPMPVSPKEPTMMYGFGVPVVIGPMNGGIDFPPAFHKYQNRLISTLMAIGRGSSHVMNRLMPGKLRSEVLLVANSRTARSLPMGTTGKVIELVENGVDLGLWRGYEGTTTDELPRPSPSFLFMGRLVAWKAVDLLLLAFRDLLSRFPRANLIILGDGVDRAQLEHTCAGWGLLAKDEFESGKVFFAGWKSQQECAAYLSRASALILPSLMECGGAVVLEAMAASRAVIATDWGGPADYIDASCGILVKPISPEAMVTNLSAAMGKLAESPQLCIDMGKAGRKKVEDHFDWEVKVDRILEIYTELALPARASN